MAYELTSRTPFGVNALSDFFFSPFGFEMPKGFESDFTPSVNIFEKDGKYNVVAEIPGMNKEDISVTVNKGILTISGKKESNKEEKEADYYLKETCYGSFYRSFQLPDEVDETKVDANYKDGILTVAVDKKEKAKSKKIEIQ